MLIYSLKRIVRAPLSSIAVILIACAFSLLFGGMTATINMQAKQLDKIYDSMIINCIFADIKGKTEGILITNSFINICLTEEYKISPYIDNPLFKRSLTYIIENGDALLVGVNSSKIDSRLSTLPDSVFMGTKYEIFVNEHSPYEVGDKVELVVRLGSRYKEVKFTVAGTYPGENTDTIYCSWNVICELALTLGGEVSAESGSFTLSNNRNLVEFKTLAEEYFDKVDISGSSNIKYVSGIALIILDKEYQTVTSAALRNINMLRTLVPLFYIVSLGIGFLVSYLLTRTRYEEFNLMRRVGVNSFVIIGCTLFEQSMLSAIGIIIGFSIVLDIKIILLLLCFVMGSFISSLLVFKKSVMKSRSE